MTPNEIEKLAGHRTVSPWIMKLVLEAVELEREACAKVCDERADSYKYATDPWAHEHISEANICAAAIRARRNNVLF